MRPLLVALAVSTLAAVGCEAQPASRSAAAVAPAPGDRTLVERPLTLGETALALWVYEHVGPGGVRYLVVHDDEDTAVAAGAEALDARSGRLVELHAQGERYVTFRLDGRDWSVDPNRIFTDAGARRTLTARTGSAPDAVVRAVRRFADEILAAYGEPRVVVALHNNTEGNYSAASYLDGGSEAAEAAAVTIPEGADPDDFFFTTSRPLYDALAAEGFPVVLQDNDGATDDGSLSVWAAGRGVPYVNVEAQHGHGERQRAMLDALARVLSRCDLLD